MYLPMVGYLGTSKEIPLLSNLFMLGKIKLSPKRKRKMLAIAVSSNSNECGSTTLIVDCMTIPSFLSESHSQSEKPIAQVTRAAL